MGTRKHLGSQHAWGTVLCVLMVFFTLAHANMFCPPAVEGAQYEITAENYNSNQSNLNDFLVTWYFGSATLMDCNLTTRICVEQGGSIFQGKNVSYKSLNFGVEAVQLQVVIGSFSTDLQGDYAVSWKIGGVSQLEDSCAVMIGNPVDECQLADYCVHSKNCSDYPVGYKCTCINGYGGLACMEGDMNLYCNSQSYAVKFPIMASACIDITIICYVAGLDSKEDFRITSRQTSTNDSQYLSAGASVSNNNVSYHVCVEPQLSIGYHQIYFTLESFAARASFDFEIIAYSVEVNSPPKFNTPGTDGRYLINVTETLTVGSIIVFVNKSMTPTCSGVNCIQVVDDNINQTIGVDSLSLSVRAESSQAVPVSYRIMVSDNSLAYFYVSEQLVPAMDVSYVMTVTDGEQATASATVIFHVLDVNEPPVCSFNVMDITLDICTQPNTYIGTVTCTDPDTEPLFRTISYSILSQTSVFSDHFCVNGTGTVSLCQSLEDVAPGVQTFTVRTKGYSEVPDDPLYVTDSPVRVTVTAPSPKCNLAIISVPEKWQVSAIVQLKLECADENCAADKLRIASWNYNDTFSVVSTQDSSTVYKLDLTVIKYLPGVYNFAVTTTFGGPQVPVSVTLQMYNPPELVASIITPDILDVSPIATSILSIRGTTDIPGASVPLSLKSADPAPLFTFQGGLLLLAQSPAPYVGSQYKVVFEGQDSVSNLTADYTWNGTILDTNEPPVCAFSQMTVTILSNIAPRTVIQSVSCSDPDITPEFHNLSYTIDSGNPTVHLEIDVYGRIYIGQPLPDNVPFVQAVVNVSDISLWTSVAVYINIIAALCPQDKTVYGLVFTPTNANSMGKTNCSTIDPIYSGEVSRFCYLNQTWGTVNYTNCTRRDLQAAVDSINRLKTGAASDQEVMNEIKATAELLNRSLATRSVILSGDVAQMVGIINGVGQLTQLYQNAGMDGITLENFAACADSLIGAAGQMWAEAQQKTGENGAQLLVGMDAITNASLRSNQLDSEEPIVKANIAIKRGSSIGDIVFPSSQEYHHYEGWVLESNNTALLKSEAFASSYGNVKYSVILYLNATDKFTVNPSIQNDKSLRDKVLNSNILSFTINADIPVLSPPLQLTFSILQANYSNASCGFLDASAREPGVWASGGCTAADLGGRIQCSCNHLTNFALLMSPFVDIPPIDITALSIISGVGCGISIFFLFVTIVVYIVLWKYVKCDRSILHMHLSVVLILAYIIFLAGVDRTDNVVGCKVVAALLHYIYLAVFFIMLSEGVEVFKSVSFVFSSDSILCKLLPFSYGLPLIIVAVSLGVSKTEGYGSKTSCWLSTKDGLIWAFVGPVLLILLINFIILIQVLRIMQNTKQMENKTEIQRTKSVVRTICILSPILGLTWVFGVLSVNSQTVVFQYLFAILNSLQGLTIFICYCLLPHQVRDGFRSLRRKYRAQSFDSRQHLSSSTPDSRAKSRTHSDTDTHYANHYNGSQSVSSPATSRTNIGQSSKTTLSDNSYSDSHGHSSVHSNDSMEWFRNDNHPDQLSYGFRNTIPLAFTDPERRSNNPTFEDFSTSHASSSKNRLGASAGHTNYAYHDSTFTDGLGNSGPVSRGRQAAAQHPPNVTPKQYRAKENWRKVQDAARSPGGPVSRDARLGGDIRVRGNQQSVAHGADL